VGCWHEGRRERPPLEREIDDDRLRATDIRRSGRGNPSAHTLPKQYAQALSSSD